MLPFTAPTMAFAAPAKIVCWNDIESAVFQNFFAEIDVCTLQPHNERNPQADILARRDNAFGDDVALHDATENVHQNTFDVLVFQNQLERGSDLLFVRAAADVEKVRGFAAGEFDDVHCRHREACAVDEAADVAVEADVTEFMLAGFDFRRIFFGEVAHFHNIGMPKQSIVVEIQFSVERKNVAVARQDKRIDLGERTIKF